MSSQQETFRSSIQSAETTKLNAVAAAIAAHQTQIDSACSENGNYSAYASAVKSANLAKLAAFDAAERAKQIAITQAKETLRGATGEIY